MMKVCYSEMDTPAGLSCRLEADGHAGYAPAGQDIVCAGASTVMQGLVYLLAGEENAHSEAFDEPDGPRLAVSVDAPCEEWVRGAFELAKACFALLAERYPENVRFADVSRRGKESMMDLQLFAAEATAACGGNREPRLGQRSDFSKPCQGAAEKSANTTRKALTVRFCCGFHSLGMSTGEPSAAVQNSGFFYLVGYPSGTRTARHYFLLKKHVQNTSGRNGSCVLCTCFLLFDIYPHGQRLICCRICAISALE